MKKLRTTTALMWRITALTLCLWFLGMGYITVIAAQDLQEQWKERADWYGKGAIRNVDNTLPGAMEYNAIQDMGCLDTGSFVWLDLPFYTDPLLEQPSYLRVDPSYETAMVYFAPDGEVLFEPGRYYCFAYVTESDWRNGSEQPVGYAYVDLDKVSGISLRSDAWGGHFTEYFDWTGTIRLTGSFQGNELILSQIAYIEKPEPLYNPDDLTLGQLDAKGKIGWNVTFESEQPNPEAVHIYTTGIDGVGYASSPVSANGTTFDNLTELIKADMQEYLQTGQDTYTKDSLWESIMICRSVTPYGYTSCSAIRCTPLLTAAYRLMRVYLLTLVILVIVLALLRRRIRVDLADPMRHLLRYGKQNLCPLPETVESAWREPYELEQGYIQLQKSVQAMKLEQQRLNAALEYSRTAEEKRREMISHITHELKTPLAVIHSYAEGLQEGIAAQRQDQYLEVILQETERMDAMVLEMLDLSRLEAGKVRLQTDTFSLEELTRFTFDRLEPMLQSKQLKVQYELVEAFEMTADEARIGQVIGNFATNAVKYTPEGGAIWINIYRYKDKAYFAIENSSDKLPDEALEKVWESFYRAEASRTTKGTGLGLTVAKTIVELHGGSCRAANTSRGVEFRFEIPQ